MRLISSVAFLFVLSCCNSTNVSPERCSRSNRAACDPNMQDASVDAGSDADAGDASVVLSADAGQSTTDVSGNCPGDMVFVEGNYCSNLEEVCLEWLDKELCVKTDPATKKCLQLNPPMRCKQFKQPSICKGKTKHMKFCIDKYEYPNQFGVKPKLQNTWYQAKAFCESQGKRLLVDEEWTQACRGNENLPYPYGYTRDATACNIDLPWQDPNTHTFEQLDKTVPAGSMPRCVSPYGVFDMTGNGDEWAVSSGGTPFKSVLKGGHPHAVRNRCSPRTDSHNETFSFYDTGFRCGKSVK